MRDNRNTTQNGVLREEPTRINGAPTGEEPRDEYHAGLVRGLLLKRLYLCRREAEKRGGRELSQDPQMLAL